MSAAVFWAKTILLSRPRVSVSSIKGKVPRAKYRRGCYHTLGSSGGGRAVIHTSRRRVRCSVPTPEGYLEIFKCRRRGGRNWFFNISVMGRNKVMYDVEISVFSLEKKNRNFPPWTGHNIMSYRAFENRIEKLVEFSRGRRCSRFQYYCREQYSKI